MTFTCPVCEKSSTNPRWWQKHNGIEHGVCKCGRISDFHGMRVHIGAALRKGTGDDHYIIRYVPERTAPAVDPDLSRMAAILGRRGGKKGGVARAQSLSPERRREIAYRAARARWDATRATPVPEDTDG